MRGVRQASVRVLEADPDLGEDLAADELEIARQAVVVETRSYPRGHWEVGPEDFPSSSNLGLLVLEGLLCREVTVGAYTCAEVLGPGDILQPWLRIGPDHSVATEVNWELALPTRVALLNRRFVMACARWPELSGAVARRMMQRVHWLAFHLAVCGLRRVDDRLLLVLWHFADRWGRVTRDGVVVDLPLTHRLLASAVGARRPSVSVAVARLVEEGKVCGLPRSRWLLLGDPPMELQQVRRQASGES